MSSDVCMTRELSLVKGFIICPNSTTHAHAREETAKIVNRRKRTEFLDSLRRKRTRQGAFEARMWHLGHPHPGGGRILEPSDGGTGAERIRAGAESAPLWEKLWTRTYANLPPIGKRVLNALATDWRTAVAARIAGVSRPTVDHWKKLFQKFFAQCFQAYRRDFRQKQLYTFS